MKINIICGIALLIWSAVTIVRGKYTYRSWFTGEEREFRASDNPAGFWTLVAIQILVAILIMNGHHFRSSV